MVASKLHIKQPGMAHASEIIQSIAHFNWRYKEVPVEITYSTYSLAKGQSGWQGFKVLFDLWFR